MPIVQQSKPGAAGCEITVHDCTYGPHSQTSTRVTPNDTLWTVTTEDDTYTLTIPDDVEIDMVWDFLYDTNHKYIGKTDTVIFPKGTYSSKTRTIIHKDFPVELNDDTGLSVGITYEGNITVGILYGGLSNLRYLTVHDLDDGYTETTAFTVQAYMRVKTISY